VEQGKPTGITRQDVSNLGPVQFEGQTAQLLHHRGHYEPGGVTHVLELHADAGDPGTWLELYGYFNRDNEFLEVRRER
jgi:hypothetical protein